MGKTGKTVICQPGDFEREQHYYQRALNAQIHPLVSYYLGLSPEALLTRYCHLNPSADKDKIRNIIQSKPKHFRWAGSDLFHVTTVEGHRQTVVIETNSCPSGQKSMPLIDEQEEHGGYISLISKTVKPYLDERGNLPEGGLAVIFDKNVMEASGYANTLADVFNEPVYLVEWYLNDEDPPARFNDEKVLEIRKPDGTWIPIRAAFRYVTQKPWNRIFVSSTKTAIINPLNACLAGGRNKALAAKAYDFYNAELLREEVGVVIRTPETIRDVSRGEVPLYVASFGGHAVVKVPYSNAGQGVYTITSQKELDEFMEAEANCPYDSYIVQSLIGNYHWSSVQRTGQFYHVGTIPNKKCNTYVSDLRMMIHFDYTVGCYRPLVIYARKAHTPLAEKLTPESDSWAMLGTNLSVKKTDDSWDTETARLLLMDRRDFNQLGISVDTLIDGFIQTVLSVTAIDNMAENLVADGSFNADLFTSLNKDEGLLKELKL